MLNSYNNIFSGLNPYRVVKDLNCPITIKEKVYFTKFKDAKEQNVIITSQDFLVTDKANPWVAGNLVDFVKSYTGSYRSAIQHLVRNYKNRMPNSNMYSEEFLVNELTLKYEKKRKIFDTLFALRSNFKKAEDFYSELMFLSSKHVNVNYLNNLLFLANPDQLNDLLSPIYDDSDFPFSIPDENFLIYPFFSSYSNICELQITTVRGTFQHSISVEKSKFSYFGLHSVDPARPTQEVNMYVKPTEALSLYGHERSRSNFDYGIISPLMDLGNLQSNLKFADVVYRYAKGENLFIPYAFKENCVNLRVGENQNTSHNTATTTFDGFLLAVFKRLVDKEKQYTPAVADFLNELKLEPKDMFIYRNYTFSAVTVAESEGGYKAQKKSSSEYIPFTNFIIKFHKTVNFPELNEMYHEGTLILGDLQIPFIAPSRSISKPQELEKVLQEAARASSSTMHPIITDISFNQALSNVLRHNLADAVTTTGVDRLGWSVTKDEFVTPKWTVSPLETHERSKVGHPKMNEFVYYAFNKHYKKVDKPAIINNSLMTIVNISLSYIYRLYNDLPVTATFIKSNKVSKNLLKFLFIGFCQTQPVIIPVNKRKDVVMPSLDLPFYGFGKSNSLLKDAKIPAFILDSKEGIDLTDPMLKGDLDEYGRLGTFFQTLMQDFVRVMIKEHGLIDIQANEEEATVVDFIAEGHQIASSILKLAQWSDFKETPILSSVLLGHKTDEYLKYWEAKDQLIFLYNDLGIQYSAVKTELESLHPDVSRVQLTRALIDKDSFLEFYKEVLGKELSCSDLKIYKEAKTKTLVDFEDEATG